MSLRWIGKASKTGHSSPCICTLKRLAVSSHYYSFFSSCITVKKVPADVPLAFMAKAIWLIQGNVSRIQKLKKRKKQPDYSFPWKVSGDMGSQKCKINLYNIMCTEPNLSWLYVSVLTPWSHFSFSFFICLWNLWVSDKLHAARQHLQLISGLLFCLHSERTQFIAADTIWRLHQADSSHAVILFSSTGDRFAHSHRQWKM